jgi:uncharacterized protein (AIM24 family)
MLKASRLQGPQIQAKLGSIVAYQGGVHFEHKGGGIGRFFKKAMAGEGTTLMIVTGTGEVFLAYDKKKVNGDNILAFEPRIDWDIQRIEGAGRLASGLFNVILQGTGKVAVTSDGEPSCSTSPPLPSPIPTLR